MIYSKTPNELLRLNIILPLAETLKGTNAYQWFRNINKMQFWSSEEITDWQNEQLKKFISHAYNHTIYYKRLFENVKITPDDIRTKSDLSKIPIITKDIVNTHFEELIPNNLNKFKYRDGKTGGTTGEPMRYYCDENVWGYITGAKIYYWKKMGYKYGDKFAALGSASLFSQKPPLIRRLYDRLRNEIPMNSVNLTDDICEQHIKQIRKQHIHYLYGYAAAIYILTQYVASHDIDLTQIKAVFTTSENLTDTYRSLIEKTYQCKVMDCYGARDAGITAYEINRNCYPVGYNTIVETADEFAPNAGTLLTTNFLNYSFPLIRYQFGDAGEMASVVDERIYNGQVIRKIYGRASDVMRLSNGHCLTATGFSMIMKEFDIVAFDINKTGENKVTLRVQPLEGKYNDVQEKLISKTIHKYIGEDCQLIIEHVSQFSPLANGKRRYFMNEK